MQREEPLLATLLQPPSVNIKLHAAAAYGHFMLQTTCLWDKESSIPGNVFSCFHVIWCMASFDVVVSFQC